MTDPAGNEQTVDSSEFAGQHASGMSDAASGQPAEGAVTSDDGRVGGDAASGDTSGDVAGNLDAAALRQELDEVSDRHLRLVAEFNNFRRRSEQERVQAWGRAQADLVGKFLDVLDDLSRVAQLDLTNATVETIMEGIDLVERKFVRMLGDVGVEVIDPAGEAFDPETMEAMMRVPAASEEEDDVVAQVMQKGYTLRGILVRPARVSVFKQE